MSVSINRLCTVLCTFCPFFYSRNSGGRKTNKTNLLMAIVVFYDLIIIRVCTKFMVYNNCLIVKSTVFFMKVKVHVNIPIFGFDLLVIEGPGIVVVNFL